MTRLEYNNLILDKLTQYLHKYPDIRFGQALVNLNIVKFNKYGSVDDPFYEESKVTFERMIEKWN